MSLRSHQGDRRLCPCMKGGIPSLTRSRHRMLPFAVTVINGIATVFSGYFLPLYNLPSFVKWLYYASYQQHALSA